LSASFIGLSKY